MPSSRLPFFDYKCMTQNFRCKKSVVKMDTLNVPQINCASSFRLHTDRHTDKLTQLIILGLSLFLLVPIYSGPKLICHFKYPKDLKIRDSSITSTSLLAFVSLRYVLNIKYFVKFWTAGSIFSPFEPNGLCRKF